MQLKLFFWFCYTEKVWWLLATVFTCSWNVGFELLLSLSSFWHWIWATDYHYLKLALSSKKYYLTPPEYIFLSKQFYRTTWGISIMTVRFILFTDTISRTRYYIMSITIYTKVHTKYSYSSNGAFSNTEQYLIVSTANCNWQSYKIVY